MATAIVEKNGSVASEAVLPLHLFHTASTSSSEVVSHIRQTVGDRQVGVAPLGSGVIDKKFGRDSTKNCMFELDDFRKNLATEKVGGLGSLLLYGHKMTSTQTLTKSLLPGVPDGFLCVADLQTSGKGRGHNVWTSPPGCLMFTFVKKYPISLGSRLTFIQYLVALAVVQSIKATPGCAVQYKEKIILCVSKSPKGLLS